MIRTHVAASCTRVICPNELMSISRVIRSPLTIATSGADSVYVPSAAGTVIVPVSASVVVPLSRRRSCAVRDWLADPLITRADIETVTVPLPLATSACPDSELPGYVVVSATQSVTVWNEVLGVKVPFLAIPDGWKFTAVTAGAIVSAEAEAAGVVRPTLTPVPSAAADTVAAGAATDFDADTIGTGASANAPAAGGTTIIEPVVSTDGTSASAAAAAVGADTFASDRIGTAAAELVAVGADTTASADTTATGASVAAAATVAVIDDEFVGVGASAAADAAAVGGVMASGVEETTGARAAALATARGTCTCAGTVPSQIRTSPSHALRTCSVPRRSSFGAVPRV